MQGAPQAQCNKYMTDESINYLNRLKDKYKDYPDNYGMLELASLEEEDNRARELEIYRDQPKTQELINAAVTRYKNCLEKLTNINSAQNMTDVERAHCFASMEWCMYTLDIIGEDPSKLRSEVDRKVKDYAQKVGLI